MNAAKKCILHITSLIFKDTTSGIETDRAASICLRSMWLNSSVRARWMTGVAGWFRKTPPLMTFGAASSFSMCDYRMINWRLLTLPERVQMSTVKVGIVWYWNDCIKSIAVLFFYIVFLCLSKIRGSEADCAADLSLQHFSFTLVAEEKNPKLTLHI